MTGVVQNQDAYMSGRIGQRAFYHRLAEELRLSMHGWTELTGRHYGLVDAYRCEDAESVLVAMGTIADTAVAVVDELRRAGRRVGCVAVTSFRPFPAARLAAVLKDARAVAVIERTDEPAAADNPLTREVKAGLADVAAAGAHIPLVASVSAGLRGMCAPAAATSASQAFTSRVSGLSAAAGSSVRSMTATARASFRTAARRAAGN